MVVLASSRKRAGGVVLAGSHATCQPANDLTVQEVAGYNGDRHAKRGRELRATGFMPDASARDKRRDAACYIVAKVTVWH